MSERLAIMASVSLMLGIILTTSPYWVPRMLVDLARSTRQWLALRGKTREQVRRGLV